jgi:hypothetical protein
MTDKPSPTCATCRWPKWRSQSGYYGWAGHCLNPLNDQVDETSNLREAMRIRNEDTCPKHTPQTEAQG